MSTTSAHLNRLNNKSGKYFIKSDLVYELITRGDGLPRINGVKGYGFAGWPSINSGGTAVYGLTSWLVMRALGIERFPWHPDERFTHLPTNNDIDRVHEVIQRFKSTQGYLDQASNDIMGIYENTQEYLRARGLKALRLSRSLGDYDLANQHGYATRLVKMDVAAQMLGLSSFELPCRLLSSWGSGGYGNTEVDLALDIPIEDVAWGDDTIASRTPASHAIERNEWVVINRNPDGNLKIPVGSISRCNLNPDSIPSFKNGAEAEEYLKVQSRIFDGASSLLASHHHPATLRLNLRARISRGLEVIFKGKLK